MIALDIMTISSHPMAMKKIRVAELKARLSEVLRLVRKGGTVTVCDRDTPIALLGPLPGKRPRLRTRPPLPGAGKWYEVGVDPLPPEVAERAMQEFLEERGRER